MQTITTKFLGPTNYRGSRVVASTISGRKVTLDWDHALNSYNNHLAAFRACAAKYDMNKGEWVPGAAPDASPYGYVFVRDFGDRITLDV